MVNTVRNVLIILSNLREVLLKLLRKKRVIHKTAEASRDLIDNNIADKITRITLQKVPETASQTDEKSIEIPKEK